MILPAQFANNVHNGEDIMFCPYCSRILYHEDIADDQAESYFDIGAAGTLAGLDDDFDDEDEDSEDEEREDDLYEEDEDSEENDDEDLDSEDSELDEDEEEVDEE